MDSETMDLERLAEMARKRVLKEIEIMQAQGWCVEAIGGQLNVSSRFYAELRGPKNAALAKAFASEAQRNRDLHRQQHDAMRLVVAPEPDGELS
jgi:hypothetical protein